MKAFKHAQCIWASLVGRVECFRKRRIYLTNQAKKGRLNLRASVCCDSPGYSWVQAELEREDLALPGGLKVRLH
jgi:hypothetical protein